VGYRRAARGPAGACLQLLRPRSGRRRSRRADLSIPALACPRDYIRQQNLYRQRVWSSKYSGEGGMTYEEAVACEHKVASVVDQVGAPPVVGI
jgi:hypothetical protein